MLDPAPEIKRQPGHPIARCSAIWFGLQSLDLLSQLLGDLLIRVEAEDPLVGSAFGGEVLLRRISRPRPNDDLGFKLARDFNRPVLAFGVHDDYLVGEAERLDGPPDVVFLVEGYDGGADLHPESVPAATSVSALAGEGFRATDYR